MRTFQVECQSSHKLLHSVHLLPHQSQVVEVSVNGGEELGEPLLLDVAQLDCGVELDAALIGAGADGMALTVLSNHTGYSMTVAEGSILGDAMPVEVI